ncbi:MAG: nucleotide exchange factor GrpE [Actinobacteria bacterium]|nr:nucleotide exchange factor GrpE [Actinomycetota bacterium]
MSPIGRPHDPSGYHPPPRPEAVAPVEQQAPARPAGVRLTPAPEVAEVVPDPEAPEAPAPPSEAGAEREPSIEDLVEELEAVIVQRDEYLELARAKQAELENFRKQMTKRQAEHAEQAAASLVAHLLPVLDALDNGISHGDESLVPVRSQLVGVLEKQGLARIEPTGEPFDPNEHDAVAHEPGEGDVPNVAETLRAGYRWNGRLLRAAMVRVRG